jgi:Na+/proline symporter
MMEHKFWKVFEGFRRITVFVIGVIVMIFALIDPDSANTVTMLIIGMIMVGVLPLENVFGMWRRPERGRHGGPAD